MAKVKLGDVAIEKRDTWAGSTQGVPIVGLEHLVPGEVTLSCWDSDTDNTFSKMFRKDQVLLGRRRVYLKKAVIAPFEGICSGDITVIEAIPGKISSRLLPFVIQNERFFDYAMQGSAGSLSPRVKWEHLKDYEFNLPDYEDQDSLADKLWSALKLKESYQRLLSATDEMVKSRFIEMFGNVEKKALKELFDVKKGSIITREQVTHGPIPVIAGGQEPSCYHNESNRPANTVTVSASGAYAGFVNYWAEPIFASDCNTITPKESIPIDPLFLYKGLLSMQDQIYTLQKGGAQPHVYGKDLEKLLFPFPKMDKQICYLAFARQADKSKFELKQAIEKIDKVMRALMQ